MEYYPILLIISGILVLLSIILASIFSYISGWAIFFEVVGILFFLWSIAFVIVSGGTLNAKLIIQYSIIIILGILFFLSSLVGGLVTYSPPVKKDEIPTEKKFPLGWTITLLIILLIIIIILFYLFNSIVLKYSFNTVILIIIAIIVIILMIFIPPIYCIYKKKPISKDETVPEEKPDIKPLNDIKLDQTDLRKKNYPVPKETLEKIIKNLRNFYAVDNCKSNKSKSCNYLFKQLTQNKNFTYKEVEEILDSMKKEALVNQSIFLVYQIAQCKLQLTDTKADVYEFGTFEWWNKNMWGDLGNGKVLWFQRFIWIISFAIVGTFILYILFKYFIPLDEPKIFTIFGVKKQSWQIIGIISFIILLISNLYLGYFYKIKGETYQIINVPNKLKKYLPSQKTPSKPITNIWFFSIMSAALIILSIITYFFNNNLFKTMSISAWLSFLIAFNIYYTWLIPQLLIIGIFLQKYILSTPITTEYLGSIIIKGIILIAVLFASFYDTTYKTTDIVQQEKEEKQTKLVKGVASSYNAPIWFIFGSLIALYILNLIETIFNQTTSENWTIIYMPFVRYVLNWVTKSSADFANISVSSNI